MLKTKSLLCKLLIDYELCVKCVFKMYNFEFPKIYSDVGLYLEILPKLIPDGETLMTRFNVVQCGLTSYCWVCESIFQKSYINATVDEIIELINQKGHISARQFKLNVRVPNIISLKQAFLAQYIYQELKAAGIDAHELKLIYNVMIVPFETNRSLDAKVILKWLLSNELNNRTNMTSTSEDSDLNLTISIDQNYSGHAVETSIMRCFSGILSLEFKKIKKSHKKVHID